MCFPKKDNDGIVDLWIADDEIFFGVEDFGVDGADSGVDGDFHETKKALLMS